MLWSILGKRSLRAKNKPGIGLFIHAVKTGQKPSLTKPGCGWKEWADEAVEKAADEVFAVARRGYFSAFLWWCKQAVESTTVFALVGGRMHC